MRRVTTMKILISHDGFVRGQPPRYGRVGELKIDMETVVELREVDRDDAPLAYLVEDDSRQREVRVLDGVFITPLTHGPEIMDRATRGAVGLGMFGSGELTDRYRDRCDWRTFASKSISPRGETMKSRSLDDWRAKNIDDSDTHVFVDAIQTTMERFVVLDGKLWTKCFEPCYRVRWGSRYEGVVDDCLIQVDIHDVKDLHGSVDGDEYDPHGMRKTAPVIYQVDGEKPKMHSRCFSVMEASLIPIFVEKLKSESRTHHVLDMANVIKEGGFPKLNVIEPSLCSSDFDVLELGRAARLHIAAWDTFSRIVKRATGRKAKDLFNYEEFEHRAARIELALCDFEMGKESPEALLETMALLRQGMKYGIRKTWDAVVTDFSWFLPPEYFGDVDNMTIDIGATFSSSPLGR